MISVVPITTAINPETLVVRLRDVAKIYKAGPIEVPALRDVSLAISANRFSMLIGKSGSGKTLGARRSDFGSLSPAATFLVKVARYF